MANRLLTYAVDAFMTGAIKTSNTGRLALVSDDWSSGSFDSALRTYGNIVSGVSTVFGANANYTYDRVGKGRLKLANTSITSTTGSSVDALVVCVGGATAGINNSVALVLYDTHPNLPWSTAAGSVLVSWSGTVIYTLVEA